MRRISAGICSLTLALLTLAGCFAEFPERGHTALKFDGAPDGEPDFAPIVPVVDAAPDALPAVDQGRPPDVTPPADGTPPRELRCEDGEDDDGDGLIDCADPDCVIACRLECVTHDLGSALGEGIGAGDNLARRDRLGSECGGNSASEVAFVWTAPADSDYLFHTLGSEIDTVLYLIDEHCAGAPIRCNDDAYGHLGRRTSLRQSALEVPLAAGQRVVVVVDGFNTAALGGVRVSIHQQGHDGCIDEDLGSALGLVAIGSNVDAPTRHLPGCGPGARDRAYLWTAPERGRYRISTAGSAFDTILTVRRGRCGMVDACDDDIVDGVVQDSELDITALPGDVFTLVVSGFEGDTGDYQLSVERRP